MIATDKILHFVGGFIIALVVTILFTPIYGFVAGFVAGVFKEILDELTYGGGDFFDFFATFTGTVMALFAYGIYIEVVA